MASSSSSPMATAQPCFSYDVFLSFRGEDTRKSFTDHLYTALKQAGLRTFRDDDAMERGKLLEPELNKAIHESALSLIVFSNDYASSEWCLNEVMMIIKEHETLSVKHEVVPVFYKVEPSDVRNQRGSFEDAFDAYDDKINAETDLEKKKKLLEKVGAWKDSLRKAATLTGMVLGDGYESEFIIDIVNVIRKKLDYKALYIEEKLVGIKDDVDAIESWLQDPSPDAVVLLIAGMGGIGKTTIAKCIFNTNSSFYEGSCFLADINKMVSNQDKEMCRLQSQLLSTILKSDKEEIVWNVHEGTNKVTKAISNKKVHSVGTLSADDAIELFSLYAFHQHQPVEPYISQSQVFVHHCKRLPLALKVLGSSLCGKTIDEWEDTMRQVAANPDPEIQEVLEISYTNLKCDTDKSLFLHIACFFEGEEKDYIVKLLAQCDLYTVVGIRNLMDRCLVYVDSIGRVMMHQLIKEMGREVVRKESPKEPGKRSKLWHHQDCIDVLQDQSGTGKVEGLMIDMQKTEEAESTSAITINNPRKHSLEGKRMHGNDANFEIGALEKMKNLMLLQLNYQTKRVWDDLEFTIGSLKILNLSYSVELTKTPDFRRLPGLESLILEGCSSLIKVDESITYLKELVLLDLSDCRSLREFPCLPTSIVSLRTSGCVVLGQVQSLDLVPSLSALVEMNISYCNLSDTFFPNDWSSLVLLERLNINGNNITFLPNCIQTLPILEFLGVENCSNIQSVLGLPESLGFLSAESNNSLEKVQLPDSQTPMNYRNCPKLCEIEGRWKVRSIDKVDRKIICFLGLEVNAKAGEGMELGLQVLHEFGIFSTYVSGKGIPSDFMYKERGPQISFQVPSHNDRSRIRGFNMCVVLFPSRKYEYFILWINVHNITKDCLWDYQRGLQKIPKNVENYAWLSLWRCGNLLEAGDQILINIYDLEAHTRNWKIGGEYLHPDVEECVINLIYEDDDEQQLLDGETKEAHNVDHISWTDRMGKDISDYVCSGGRHSSVTTTTPLHSTSSSTLVPTCEFATIPVACHK
ncbi:unnamed protein product [Lactuca virosa]|uniref:ADP-ribosyl cyclase/cyclic ADP-ribose hydrolase n=1 Tax=Lactuca virosa TaxID=75947 RepID=A0AAU9MJA6_9ASTR|nr:unnamed protein product [Lactuca virosa]